MSENNPVGGAPARFYSDELHPPGQRYWGTRWWLLTLAVLFVVVMIVAALGGRSGPSAKGLTITGNSTRTWPGSAGSAYFGVDLVNDTDTTMVVDSVTVVTDQGQALSGAAATQVSATVAAIDLTSTTSPAFTPGTGWRPPPLPAQGFPIDGHGSWDALVVTVHPQCPGLAIPATATIVVGYHNTTQSFTLTVDELTGANQPLTALVRQACG